MEGEGRGQEGRDKPYTAPWGTDTFLGGHWLP